MPSVNTGRHPAIAIALRHLDPPTADEATWDLVAVELLDRGGHTAKVKGPFKSEREARDWLNWQGISFGKYRLVPMELPDWPEPAGR